MNNKEKRVLERGRNIIKLDKAYKKMEFIADRANKIVILNEIDD